MKNKGLDLLHNTRDARHPDDRYFVAERNEAVTVLCITLEVLAATANDLVLPANRLRPEIVITYFVTATGNQNITGFANIWPGRRFKIVNRDAADNVVIQHQNAGSVAPHRVISPTAADYTLGPYESAELAYSPDDARWIIVNGTGA